MCAEFQKLLLFLILRVLRMKFYSAPQNLIVMEIHIAMWQLAGATFTDMN